MKKLGLGLMRLPTNSSAEYNGIDINAVKDMVDEFLAQGFTYFDTAYFYHGGHSELAIREALTSRHPRESYVLADKLPIYSLNSMEDNERCFAEQLDKCGVEYFDYYLLHAMNRSYYDKCEQIGSFQFMVDLKAEGKVKHIGFSYHDDSQLLDEILTKHPEMEFVQLQINYIDWYDDANVDSRRCYEVARKHGKDIIIMEPVKGGLLANVSQQCKDILYNANATASIASWAVRYCASLEGVFMVLSGMSNMEQLTDNMSYMQHFVPLTAQESDTIIKVSELIRSTISVPCTNCKYCVDDCPMNIKIPTYFHLYNQLHQYPEAVESIKGNYKFASQKAGKASQCIQCGACEGRCPQKIKIIDSLAKVAMELE